VAPERALRSAATIALLAHRPIDRIPRDRCCLWGQKRDLAVSLNEVRSARIRTLVTNILIEDSNDGWLNTGASLTGDRTAPAVLMSPASRLCAH
jgi:hypothetical protein